MVSCRCLRTTRRRGARAPTTRARWPRAGPGISRPTFRLSRRGQSGRWRRWCSTRPSPAITGRSPSPRSSRICRTSGSTAGTKPTAKAGRSTPRRWATTWASTGIPTRTSERSTIRCGGQSGSWSTPAFTHSAGAASRRSTTSRSTPPSPSERSWSRSIATSSRPARRWPTRSASGSSWNFASEPRGSSARGSTSAPSTTRCWPKGRCPWTCSRRGSTRGSPSARRPELRLDPEQLRRRPAEHRHAFVVAQAWRAEDVVDRRLRPRERIVGAHHDLTGPGLGDEVAQRLGREDERVEVELLEILRRLLLQRLGAPVGEGHADRVGTRRVGRQIAAAVGRADLQPGKAVERTFEDQVRERDRGLERIADGVLETAAALQPRLEVGRGAIGLRVDEHQHAELLGLGPERVELRVGQILAGDAAAHTGAAQAVLLDALFQLLGGEVWVLERHRRERDEAFGVRGAGFRQLFVLDPDQLARDVAVGPVPVRVDAQGLH